jgi:two-component system response regulator AtoC
MGMTLEQLEQASKSLVPILIEGESGVGKELAARAVHAGSPYSNGPFVAVDCGALPEGLAESELFGVCRGAFSDARESRSGLLEAANGGSLFLDEIGNLPVNLQPKLLRVLQMGEYRRLGDTRLRRVRFRLIAATNSHLEQAVDAGRFRRDLYYRVAGIRATLLPLRQRLGDVGILAEHIVTEICREVRRSRPDLTPAALAALQRHDWPGNVRELRNVLAAVLAFSESSRIDLGDLEGRLSNTPRDSGKARRRELALNVRRLEEALARTRGDKSAAARLLGWSRMRVYRTLRRASAVTMGD